MADQLGVFEKVEDAIKVSIGIENRPIIGIEK
jgi:hypothetical protein